MKWLRWIPSILWMALIYYLSSRTGDEINTILPFFQKFLPFIQDFNWGHFVSYFILAMTFDFAFGKKSTQWRYKLIIVLLCTLYGATDEIHQYYVGGRMMDWYDLRNDCIGATLWVLLIKIPYFQKVWKKLSYTN